MWFRLKEDYITHIGEIHQDSWDTAKIKKGALIVVRLRFGPNHEIETYFIFLAGELQHLDLSMLELPNYCVKDYSGDVFCATKQRFFYASYSDSNEPIAKQLVHCPLCGQKLREENSFPQEENLENYKVLFPS